MPKEINKKRLFFGLEVYAPWPEKLPMGRLLDEKHRHLTLAFIGSTDWDKLSKELPNFPIPPFKVGLTGLFDKCQFLPKRHSNVVAWHVHWLDDNTQLLGYQKKCVEWLIQKGFTPSQPDRKWLPHTTLCRKPFNARQWNDEFIPLPMFFTNLNLYESLGNSQYNSIWTSPIIPPFQEIEHTADLAFSIHGENLDQIFNHARTALAFSFPAVLPYFNKEFSINSLDDVIISLNSLITETDQKIGCPFKAVSFHGDLTETKDKIYQWEMIIDV